MALYHLSRCILWLKFSLNSHFSQTSTLQKISTWTNHLAQAANTICFPCSISLFENFLAARIIRDHSPSALISQSLDSKTPLKQVDLPWNQVKWSCLNHTWKLFTYQEIKKQNKSPISVTQEVPWQGMTTNLTHRLCGSNQQLKCYCC